LDGYTSIGSCTGSRNDCNDARKEINPGATEVCGNDIDEDCDGEDPICIDITPTPTPGRLCSDTDGGVTAPLRGTVSWFRIVKLTDLCIGSGYLVEYYCDPRGDVPSLKLLRCRTRCGSGACQAFASAKVKTSSKIKKRIKKLRKQLSSELERAKAEQPGL